MPPSLFPPGPELRTFLSEGLTVKSYFSAAGLSSSYFISSPKGRIIVDCGDGCLRDMIELARSELDDGGKAGFPDLVRHVEGLFGALITHGHYDHCSGLTSVLGFLHVMGRRSPFTVVGPEGAYYIWSSLDHFERTLWEESPFRIIRKKVRGKGALRLGPYSVQHRETEHRDSRPGVVGGCVHALCYRVEVGSSSVFFSGDCSDTASLKGLAKDADLAVVEATFPSSHPDQVGVHLTVEMAKELGACAKSMWLVHLTAMSAALLREI